MFTKDLKVLSAERKLIFKELQRIGSNGRIVLSGAEIESNIKRNNYATWEILNNKFSTNNSRFRRHLGYIIIDYMGYGVTAFDVVAKGIYSIDFSKMVVSETVSGFHFESENPFEPKKAMFFEISGSSKIKKPKYPNQLIISKLASNLEFSIHDFKSLEEICKKYELKLNELFSEYKEFCKKADREEAIFVLKTLNYIK